MTRVKNTLFIMLAVLLTAGVMVAGQSIAASTSKSQCVTGVDYQSLTEAELNQFDAN